MFSVLGPPLFLIPIYFVVTAKLIIGAIRTNLLRIGWTEVV
jgi:hypothetical protein